MTGYDEQKVAIFHVDDPGDVSIFHLPRLTERCIMAAPRVDIPRTFTYFTSELVIITCDVSPMEGSKLGGEEGHEMERMIHRVDHCEEIKTKET